MKSKGMEKDITILTLIKGSGSNYINFRQRRLKINKVMRDKEGHYIMTKGSILQEDITILNMYASNNSVKLCEAKMRELQGETDGSTLFSYKWTDI